MTSRVLGFSKIEERSDFCLLLMVPYLKVSDPFVGLSIFIVPMYRTYNQ
jgi:hypothetical protein